MYIPEKMIIGSHCSRVRGIILLLVFMLIIFPSFGLFADDDFGDPFGQNEEDVQTEEESEEIPADIQQPDDEREREFTLAGEAGYFPLIKYSPDEDVSFVSNRITGVTDIGYSFADCDILGRFTLDITPYVEDDLYEFFIKELYFGYHSDMFNIKAGYTTLDWSVMNVFTLTNYYSIPSSLNFDLDLFDFNPDDMDLEIDYSRFIDSEEETDAVPGLYALFYYQIFSLELMVSPPFFYNKYSSYVTDALSLFTFPANVTLDFVDNPPDTEIANIGFTSRLGMTINSADVYVSYFHGYDNRMLYTTTTEIVLPMDLNIEVDREYTMVDRIGASLSWDIFGCILNAEALFSFSDPVLYYETTSYPDPLGDIIDIKKEETTTIEISAGCDWEFINNFRLIFEYNDFFILEDIPDIVEEILHGDTLFGALRYTLALSNMEITIMPGILYDYGGNEITSINSIECDFLNGFTVELLFSYFYVTEITGETSDSFKIMNEDIIAGLFMRLSF